MNTDRSLYEVPNFSLMSDNGFQRPGGPSRSSQNQSNIYANSSRSYGLSQHNVGNQSRVQFNDEPSYHSAQRFPSSSASSIGTRTPSTTNPLTPNHLSNPSLSSTRRNTSLRYPTQDDIPTGIGGRKSYGNMGGNSETTKGLGDDFTTRRYGSRNNGQDSTLRNSATFNGNLNSSVNTRSRFDNSSINPPRSFNTSLNRPTYLGSQFQPSERPLGQIDTSMLSPAKPGTLYPSFSSQLKNSTHGNVSQSSTLNQRSNLDTFPKEDHIPGSLNSFRPPINDNFSSASPPSPPAFSDSSPEIQAILKSLDSVNLKFENHARELKELQTETSYLRNSTNNLTNQLDELSKSIDSERKRLRVMRHDY